MSILGNETDEMARLYVKQANTKVLAGNAVAKWENDIRTQVPHKANGSCKETIEFVMEFSLP